MRDSAAGMEAFMVVRHHQIDFASGALVFPGGSVDDDDRVVAATPARLVAGDLDQASLTLRIAAIRETFEECGVLLARPTGARSLLSPIRLAALEEQHRAALAKGDAKFSAMLRDEDLVLATDLLVPFAHWITPPTVPKRFDTHFFLAVAPADQLAVHDGHESVDSVWIAPQAALQGAEAGRYTIIFPTRLNLEKLGRSATPADAIAAARADRIVTVMPKMTRTETGFRLSIPVEAGYGGPDFDTRRT